MSIAQNIGLVQERIRASAARAHRDPQAITLIAVTKYVTVSEMNEAIRCGITDIAENRVQDGSRKFPFLEGRVTKHLIGTLQTNKVKTALAEFDLIHSVDRPELVMEMAKQALKLKRPIRFLIQLNISGEATKHGLSPQELRGFLEFIAGFPLLLPSGLMTMAPQSTDPESSRPIFRELKRLFDGVAAAHHGETSFQNNWRYLSMGMSQDYTVAVEEGANLLRVGTAIFKENLSG